MRLYYRAGDRTAALRQFERCITALCEELDVRPGKRTLVLYDQIRKDQM
jgi:DNA-binding SARP family transcriptional activator